MDTPLTFLRLRILVNIYLEKASRNITEIENGKGQNIDNRISISYRRKVICPEMYLFPLTRIQEQKRQLYLQRILLKHPRNTL